MVRDAGDHDKPLGTQAGEAHHEGNLILGCVILTAHQHVTGKHPNSSKKIMLGRVRPFALRLL